jgi:hypothetical protein
MMRQLVVNTFLTLDGVMQAPGGPGERWDGGVDHGGWSTSYFDDRVGEVMGEITARPLGTGERLFGDGTVPTGLKLIDIKTSDSGVIAARYEPATDLKYGSFAVDEATDVRERHAEEV